MVPEKINSSKKRKQAENLEAEEAFIKKRQYQGKMTTEIELAYWEEELKGFKKYSE